MDRAAMFLLAVVLSARSALATVPGPAFQLIPASCPAVSAAALHLFTANGFGTIPNPACPGCLALNTTHLHDPQHHSLRDVRTVMRRYMSIGREQDIPGAWYVHSGLKTYGELTLAPEGQACRAELLFHFSWYATEFLLIVPVDGDPATRPSNLKLEAEYLAALSKASRDP